MTREGYQLREVRPGRFAKIVDGEVVGMASEVEVLIDRYREHVGFDVNPSMIEVTLALEGITAIMATQEGLYLAQYIVVLVAFYLSFIASLLLYHLYLLPRVPYTQTYYCRLLTSEEWMYSDTLLVMFSYPLLFVWLVLFAFRPPRGANFGNHLLLEFAHITLFMVVFLLGCFAGSFVFERLGTALLPR